MDSDEIAGHLKSKHEITHKDYNSRFMNLIKEEKAKSEKGPKLFKTKKNIKNNTKESESEAPNKKQVYQTPDQVNSEELEIETTSSIEKCKIVSEDFEAGPSSGHRLSEKQREENIENLFKLQRSLLKMRTDDEEDDYEITENSSPVCPTLRSD